MLACGSGESARMAAFPKLMLWAWEREEAFPELPVDRIGVAYLRQTLVLRGERLEVRPRRQPLKVPPGTRLVAVTRIEVDGSDPFRGPTDLSERCVERILRGHPADVSAIQLDFDAKASQRPFYGDLIRRLRARMDPGWALSMTALASWALSDPWMRDLPVDEFVPMAFDMGRDGAAVKELLRRRQDFRTPPGRTAVGVASREALPWIPKGRRVYVFSHRSWQEHDWKSLLREYAP